MLALLGAKGIIILIVAAGILAGVTGLGVKIYYAGRHAVEVENLHTTIDALKRQEEINRAAAHADAEAALNTEAKMGELEAAIIALSNSLDDGACLSAEETEKLRALWLN